MAPNRWGVAVVGRFVVPTPKTPTPIRASAVKADPNAEQGAHERPPPPVPKESPTFRPWGPVGKVPPRLAALRDKWKLGSARIPHALRFHWPLYPLLVFALLVRTFGLFPTFFYGDDAEYATVASYLAANPTNLAYPRIEGFGPTPFVSQPPLLLYLFGWTGALVGDQEVGAVLVSVLLGTATVGVVYAIGATFRSRTLGVFAGLFLSVFPAHVTLSRKGFLDAGFTFFFTLTIFLFLLWVEHKTLRLAWATGVAMAATVFSKLPGVLVLVPLGLGIAWEAARLLRRRAFPAPSVVRRFELKLLFRHTGIALVPLAILSTLYLGLLWYLQSTKDLFRKLGWQVDRVAPGGEASSHPEPWHWYLTNAQWGLPGQLGLVLAVFATVGLFLFLAPMARKGGWTTRRITLIAWPLVILVFFTLSARKEWFYILPLTPPLALLAALPAAHIILRLREWAAQHDTHPARRARAVATASFLLIAAPGFAPFQASAHGITEVEEYYGKGVKDAALRIHELDPEAGQIGSLLGRYTLHFYNRQPTYHWFLEHDFIEREIEAGRLRYMVVDAHLPLAHERAWMEELATKYDGHIVATWQSWNDQTMVWLYEFPRRSQAATATAATSAAIPG